MIGTEVQQTSTVVFPLSDRDLIRAIELAIGWDTLVSPDRVSASVSSGHVILEGTVTDERDLRALERAVVRVPGVHKLVNLCEVDRKS